MADHPELDELPTGAALRRVAMRDGVNVRVMDVPPRGGETARGRVLLAGGRGDFIEKYADYAAHLAGRGWAVTAFDWRGQGDSDRPDGRSRVGHADDFAPWVADLRELADLTRTAGGGPLVLIGHSMGGHLVLRALAEGRVRPDAAVLVAPMLGFHGPPAWMARPLARLLARVMGARAAWGGGEKPGARADHATRRALLTHDDARYDAELRWLAARPELATGPGSWGWIAAAYASMAVTSDPARLSAISTPVLALVAEADRLVDARATRRLLAQVPTAEVVTVPAPARHELLREAEQWRAPLIARIDAWLDVMALRP